MLTFYRVTVDSLFSNLSFTIFSGGILYICGEEKSGKSILLKFIVGLHLIDYGNLY